MYVLVLVRHNLQCFICVFSLYVFVSIYIAPFQWAERRTSSFCPFYFCNSFCIKHFDWCLFLFCMSYNVPCLIFLNMFCIVLYAYTLICLYICLKWTHFNTTAMFLTSHEFPFSQRHAAFSFAIRMDFCSLQRHFPLLHYACFKWEYPSDMPYWICVEWQKSVQLGNIFKMFITQHCDIYSVMLTVTGHWYENIDLHHACCQTWCWNSKLQVVHM